MAISRIGGKALKANLERDSNLAFNTTTLVVDYATGRIGVGTASPTHLLTVDGTAKVTGAATLNSTLGFATGVTANKILDEDDMSSNDASALSTQQAIKAYVDAQISGSAASIGDLSITGTTIATVDSNANIVLDPNGTGIVDIDTTLAMQLPKGTTAQRPGSPAAGYLRYNTTNNNVETYNGSAWVIVGDPDTSTVHVDSFSGDGATTGFTMGGSASTNQLIVTLNGVVQKPTEVYSASGTTLTFTTAPDSGDDISIRRFVATVDNSIVLDNDGDTKIQVEESADEDTIRFDAAGTEVMTMTSTVTTAKTPVQFASYTTAARDSLSGVNGMVIYNSSTGKFQGYAGGSWVDLH